jgi:hypothetical protein
MLRSRGGLAEASNTSTRKTFSGRVIHKIFHADKFKSFVRWLYSMLPRQGHFCKY